MDDYLRLATYGSATAMGIYVLGSLFYTPKVCSLKLVCRAIDVERNSSTPFLPLAHLESFYLTSERTDISSTART